MKNIEKWKPTKFIYNKKGHLVANKDYVSLASLMVANKAGILYQEYIIKYAQGILLDLGCGTVPFYDVYKNKVIDVICIDWENSYHKNIHLDLVADLNKTIPLESSSVDTIILSDVLEHISEPRHLMSEISRILKNDGILIMGVPFMYWLHEIPFDYHRYTKYQLEKLCNNEGLNVKEIEEWGGPFAVVIDILSKNWPRYLFPKIFHWAAIKFLNSHLGKRIDKKRKQHFPLGYCLVAQKEKVV